MVICNKDIQFHANCQEIPKTSKNVLQNNSSAQIKCTQAQSSILTHNYTLKMRQLSTSLMSNFTLSVSMLPRNISPTQSQDNFHQNSISNVSRLRGTHTISMCPLSKHPQLSSMPTDCVIFVCFLDFKCIEENLLLNPSDRQSILTSYFLIILISYFPSICVQLPRISTFKRLDWWEITTNFKKTRPCHPR